MAFVFSLKLLCKHTRLGLKNDKHYCFLSEIRRTQKMPIIINLIKCIRVMTVMNCLYKNRPHRTCQGGDCSMICLGSFSCFSVKKTYVVGTL